MTAHVFSHQKSNIRGMTEQVTAHALLTRMPARSLPHQSQDLGRAHPQARLCVTGVLFAPVGKTGAPGPLEDGECAENGANSLA